MLSQHANYSLTVPALAPGRMQSQRYFLISWFLKLGGFEKVLIATTIVLFYFILDTWDTHPPAGSFLNHFST